MEKWCLAFFRILFESFKIMTVSCLVLETKVRKEFFYKTILIAWFLISPFFSAFIPATTLMVITAFAIAIFLQLMKIRFGDMFSLAFLYRLAIMYCIWLE